MERSPSLKAIIETAAIGIIGGRPDITTGKVSIYDVGYGAMLPGCVANMNGTLLLENASNVTKGLLI
ncbi:hypothetical protein [Methylobacter sp.]|uniref:hypothetical protein n=1 Tax=Methylobacter sp. TaxID=2051955 RepID=UPI001212EB82|nr:hypothetical protein [Methylobacter sp.]TAK63198.1 MAG: hypothetical protein EPO18_07755 [Methylobacter sp.]